MEYFRLDDMGWNRPYDDVYTDVEERPSGSGLVREQATRDEVAESEVQSVSSIVLTADAQPAEEGQEQLESEDRVERNAGLGVGGAMIGNQERMMRIPQTHDEPEAETASSWVAADFTETTAA